MAKKAYLVYFSIGTRVIAEDELENNELIIKARNKILKDPGDYICGDNCDSVEEDTECPYDPTTEENELNNQLKTITEW